MKEPTAFGLIFDANVSTFIFGYLLGGYIRVRVMFESGTDYVGPLRSLSWIEGDNHLQGTVFVDFGGGETREYAVKIDRYGVVTAAPK